MKIRYLGTILDVEDDNIDVEVNGNEATAFIGGQPVDTFYIEELITELVREKMEVVEEEG